MNLPFLSSGFTESRLTAHSATQNAKKHERKGMDNTGGFGEEKSAELGVFLNLQIISRKNCGV
ncbi:hypothetical protein CBI71_13980 [Salmonella enterica]|nr:hypothetical protein CBI71_13980 [Salmonella enterica]